MFRAVIRSTPLVSGVADEVFSSITGEYYSDDVSFLSTLRALVYPRMGGDESLALRFCPSLGDIEGRLDESGVIQIVDFAAHGEDAVGAAGTFEALFGRHPGWHRLVKVTDFFRKTLPVMCFINTELKSTVLIAVNMNIRTMHYLQCAIPAILPWYFDPTVGLSEQEMELINSCRGKNSQKYEECMAKIAAQYDFREQKIRKLLAGFETRYERCEAEKIRIEIQRSIRDIDCFNERIGNCLREKAEKEIRLLGLEAKIKSGESEDSELMEYCLCNKRLVLESVTDRSMAFACYDYLTYFDEDIAEQAIENRHSYVYYPSGGRGNSGITDEEMRNLMRAIFIDRKLRIRFCAAYTLDLGRNVIPRSAHSYGWEFRECMPNPHIDVYGCMGNYTQAVNRLLTSHDYIGAIEQCIASCKSLNFGDIVVMGKFMGDLYGDRYKCIELPDGSAVTPKEAIEWLNIDEGECCNE